MYAINELNPLPEHYHETVTHHAHVYVDWADPKLARIVRLRLLGDTGYPWLDVSYCHGQLQDGSYVIVSLPFSRLPRRGARKALVDFAIKDGVNAKRLGALDNLSILF